MGVFTPKTYQFLLQTQLHQFYKKSKKLVLAPLSLYYVLSSLIRFKSSQHKVYGNGANKEIIL